MAMGILECSGIKPLPARLPAQEFAVRMLKRADERRKEERRREAQAASAAATSGKKGEWVNKLEDIEKAVGDLGMAHRLFFNLHERDVRQAGLDQLKLKRHMDFCHSTHKNAELYLAKVTMTMYQDSSHKVGEAQSL